MSALFTWKWIGYTKSLAGFYTVNIQAAREIYGAGHSNSFAVALESENKQELLGRSWIAASELRGVLVKESWR